MTIDSKRTQGFPLEEAQVWNTANSCVTEGYVWRKDHAAHADELICAKCLLHFEDRSEARANEIKKHKGKCRIEFSHIIFQGLNMKIANITGGSPQIERQICERMSKLSMVEKGPQFPVLSENNWCAETGQSNVFLLIQGVEIIGYLHMYTSELIGERRSQPQTKVADMFIICRWRRNSFMRFLLLKSLESINERFETVCFQEPITDQGKKFLERMKEELGRPYQTFFPTQLSSFF